MRRLAALFLVTLPLAVAGGCSGNPLGNAQVANVVDTVILGALVGTPISVPSAFAVAASAPVRTDQTANFDFVYNVEPDGRRVFIPLAALGFSGGTVAPGFQSTNDPFEAIDQAPLNGYNTLDTVALAVGQRYIVRGRVTCTTLGVPTYAKLEILAFDDADRQVTFQVLADRNCGFRSLLPGIPDN
jgi:hypothetical protein